MEFIIQPETLRRELRVFQSIILKDSQAGELSNVKIETHDDRLIMYGTDLGISMKAITPAETVQVITPGKVCIKAGKLISMLETMSDSVKSVRLRREENDWTSVLFGRSQFKIVGVPADTFPLIQYESQNEPTEFSVALLKQFIGSTEFAVSKDDGKYLISGANLAIADGRATMVGTDGFRIAVIESQIGGTFNEVIPKKALGTLYKLLTETEEKTCLISSDQAHVFFKLGNRAFSFRKLVGEFPNVAPAIPQAHEFQALFNLEELRGAVKRADIFAEKNANSPINFILRENEAELGTQSFEEGQGREFIGAVYAGPEKKLRLKSSHLVDFFNSLNGGSNIVLKMQFSTDNKIATIWSVHSEESAEKSFDYKCVIVQLQ